MTRPTLLTSLSRRAASCVSLAAVALTAACSDAPTSPAANNGPSSVLAAKASGGANFGSAVTAEIQVLNSAGEPVNAVVDFYTDKAITQVRDNGPDDLEPSSGRLRVVLPSSNGYRAKVVGTFDLGGQVALDVPQNSSSGKQSGQKVSYTPITLPLKPIVWMHFLDKSKQLLPGATAVIYDANGSHVQSLGDGPYDPHGPLDGKVVAYLPKDGTYTACEMMPPTGYVLTSQKCITIAVKWGTETTLAYFHTPGIIAPPEY
jgi:hypothetical protein